MRSEALASASLRSYAQHSVPGRAALEGAFGVLLVAWMIFSTVDEALGPTTRALFVGCFAALTIVNVGAATAVYIATALVFSVHHSGGDLSYVERPDNIAFLFLTAYLVAGRGFRRSAGRFGSTATVIALFVLTAVIHLIALVGVEWFWFAWFARMFGIPLTLFVLLRRAALSTGEVRGMLVIMAALSIYLAVVSLLEVVDWHGLILPPWIADPDFNPIYGAARVGGVAMQAEWNALQMSLGLCVLLLVLAHGRSGARIGWALGAALCLVAIYFCYTRAAYLGLVVGGIPLLWQRAAGAGTTIRRRMLFLAGVIGFAGFVLLFPSQMLQDRVSDTGNVYFRLNIWAAAVGMIKENPLFGVGFGHFSWRMLSYLRDLGVIPSMGPYAEGNLAHNTTLSVAAELGLVGLTLYGLVIWGVFKVSRDAAGSAWGQVGRLWVAGFTLVYLVNIQFVTAHMLGPNAMYFGVLGAIAGMRHREGHLRPAPVLPAT
jgi:O-antigen ligase